MRIIPTRIHAVLDYIAAIALLGLPYMFDAWGTGGAKTWVPMALGVAVIVYSLLTDYELGLVPLLPMPVHLLIDILGGVALAASPFVFGFWHEIWVPYVALGIFEVVVSALTKAHAGALPGLKRA